jgi:hypothetical protein
MMRHFLVPFVLIALLSGCSSDKTGIRVTNDSAAASSATGSRREPIFYNGKTYQLDFAPLDGGSFAMAVSGMGKGQQKDAVAVATSSLRCFKCPDGQNGTLTDQPEYVDSQWRMTARCT